MSQTQLQQIYFFRPVNLALLIPVHAGLQLLFKTIEVVIMQRMGVNLGKT